MLRIDFEIDELKKFVTSLLIHCHVVDAATKKFRKELWYRRFLTFSTVFFSIGVFFSYGYFVDFAFKNFNFSSNQHELSTTTTSNIDEVNNNIINENYIDEKNSLTTLEEFNVKNFLKNFLYDAFTRFFFFFFV
jgi:hypothetical protein